MRFKFGDGDDCGDDGGDCGDDGGDDGDDGDDDWTNGFPNLFGAPRVRVVVVPVDEV